MTRAGRQGPLPASRAAAGRTVAGGLCSGTVAHGAHDVRRPKALDGPWTQPGLVAIRMPESSRACGSLQGRWSIASAEVARAARDGLRARTAPVDAGRPLAAGMPRVFERRAGCSGTVVHLGRGFGDPGPGLGTGLRCRVPASAAFSDPARNIPDGLAGLAGRDGPLLRALLMPPGGPSTSGRGIHRRGRRRRRGGAPVPSRRGSPRRAGRAAISGPGSRRPPRPRSRRRLPATPASRQRGRGQRTPSLKGGACRGTQVGPRPWVG